MDDRAHPGIDLRAFEAGVSLGDYLRVVVRRKWAVVIIFMTTVLLSTLVSLRMPRVYETSATIKINQRVPNQSLLASFYFDPFFLETEMEMIRSRAIVARVANRLGMTYRVLAAPPPLREALKDMEVADGTPPGDIVITFASPTTFDVSFNKRAEGSGRVGERFKADFGSFVVDAAAAKRGDRIELETKNVGAAVGQIRGMFQVRAIENVNMVRIAAKGRDPQRVAGLANALADTYIDATLEEKRLQATSTRMFIEDQIQRTAENLRQAEEALENFKRAHGIIDIDAETKGYISMLGELEAELLKNNLDRQIDAAELGMLRDRRARHPSNGDGFPTDDLVVSHFAAGSTLAALEERLLDLHRQRSELLKTRTADHPAVRALDGELATVNKEFSRALGDVLDRGELATNIKVSDEKTAAIESWMTRYRERSARLPEKEMDLNRLMRAYEVNENVYSMLLEKLQEAKINEAMETADIRVVDYALVPKTPISPNYVKNILVGVFLGFFLGIGVAYALEFADTSLNSVEEVERRLSRSVIGIIPRIGGGPVERLVSRAEKYDAYFVTHNFPKSPVAEAYRTLRTAVLASGVDVEVASVLVTSTGLSEGKTNTAVNLAIVFAQAGNNVLLLDCDLRRAKAHRAFEIPRAPGLTEVIMGSAELEDAVRPTSVEHLSVLPSGEVPPNPSELLGSKKYEKILAKLTSKYSRVIIDAPPVLAVTDALVLSSLASGVCFVVCAARTDRNAARRGLSLLERTGCRVLGIVFNQVDMTRVFGTYGYKYYSQYYKAYQEGVGS